jgi:OOP family OmpA-OmpF porin
MRSILTVLSVGLAFSACALAGGKTVSPAVSPVAEVESEMPFYVGIGALMSSLTRDPCPCNPDGPNLDDHRYGVIARAGWNFHDYFGLEGRYLRTFGEKAFSKVEHYGLYLKPYYPLTEQSNIYALIGYGKTKVKYDNGIFNYNTNSRYCYVNENGFAYGLGFEYDFEKKSSLLSSERRERTWGAWIDFQHLLSNAGEVHTDLNVATVGLYVRF